MKILIATIVSALALSGAGAGANLGVHRFASGGGEQRPVMDVCVAGMQISFGGASPVSLSMSQSGRCGCPDSCSVALVRVLGLTLRL